MRSPLLLPALLLALAALPARAAEPRPLDLTLGFTAATYLSFFRSTAVHPALELALDAAPFGALPGLRLGGGVRGGLPAPGIRVPLEGFLRARLTAALGAWEPAVGPEVGLTGRASIPPPASGLPDDLDALEAERVGPLYVGFTAAPARFRLGRWLVSAGELQVGVSMPPLGAAARFQVGLLTVGVGL